MRDIFAGGDRPERRWHSTRAAQDVEAMGDEVVSREVRVTERRAADLQQRRRAGKRVTGSKPSPPAARVGSRVKPPMLKASGAPVMSADLKAGESVARVA